MISTDLLSGMVIMGYALAALFFARFWKRTGDRLFLAFSAAFVLLAVGPLLMIWLEVPREEQSPFFLIRLAAFSLIILAVVGKSRASR